MIAFYLRLSMADGDLGDNMKDESNSIENQRLLLQSYVMDREDLAEEVLTEFQPLPNLPYSIGRDGNILNALEYVDDGYSGTNFERPSFQKMIGDCRSGLVTTIIVKDLSRFGRNYIGVGDYIDQLFPLLNIRFIAVNHNYDSSDFEGEPMGFDLEVNSLISTLYSRDLSKKQKSVRVCKWKQGKSTSGVAPYGYLKDPDNKGKFVIDPEAGEVVKLIFRLACEGMKSAQIAYELNERGIKTPGMYNREKHLWPDTVRAKESEQLWKSSGVSKILRRYEYTGALVAGRYECPKIGSSKTIIKPKRDWTIVEGVNPPLVSKEEFETAENVVRKQKTRGYIIRRNYVLKGKVRCGNCGRMMTYEDSCYEEKYYCRSGISAGKFSECTKETIPAKKIIGCVKAAVRLHCREIVEGVDRLTAETNGAAGLRAAERLNAAHFSTEEIERQIKRLKEERLNKYEMYADGSLSREEYMKTKTELTGMITQLDARKKELEADRAKQIQENSEKKAFTELGERAAGYLEEDDLSAEMVEDMVKEVRVYDSKRIEVELNYADVIEKYAGEAAVDIAAN